MPHVTFIHGIANKPPREDLLRAWESAFADGGLDLGANDVGTSMVYWADVVYAAPEAVQQVLEAVATGLGTSESDEELAWIESLPADERATIMALRDRLGFDEESPDGEDFEPGPPAADDEAAVAFEAIPLPWFLKRRLMKRLLKDVHHYLFDAEFSPRPGENYRVREHIRGLFVDQLKADAAANDDGPHVVLSHSMGTVISYDCLKNVPACPSVDGYMTVGSPLGISEVHDNFEPRYDKQNAFPAEKLGGDWVNVYDRLDPVAFDSRIANDYKRGGEEVIIDHRVNNSGRWRHSGHKYFSQPSLCDHLRRLLDL